MAQLPERVLGSWGVGLSTTKRRDPLGPHSLCAGTGVSCGWPRALGQERSLIYLAPTPLGAPKSLGISLGGLEKLGATWS